MADSALYAAETVAEVSNHMKWITRVPEKVKAASEVTCAISKEEMDELSEGYRGLEVCSIYEKIPQRWLLVYSEQAYSR